MTTSKTQATAAVKDAARSIIEAIVTKPKEVAIDARRMGEILAIEIRVSADDTPRIVGREGSHIDAIKTVLAGAGMARAALKVITTLLEPTGERTQTAPMRFQPNPRWKTQNLKDVLGDVLDCFLEKPYKIDAEDLREVTLMQIKPHKDEQWVITQAVDSALKLLVDIIGKGNGRIVQLAATNEQDEEEENGTNQRERASAR